MSIGDRATTLTPDRRAFHDNRLRRTPLTIAIPLLFAVGIAFGYFVVLSTVVCFLQNFNSDQLKVLRREVADRRADSPRGWGSDSQRRLRAMLAPAVCVRSPR